MIDFDSSEPPKLFEKFGLEFRKLERHRSEKYPLLDELLPILEYDIEQLRGSGFLDAWLSAAIRAEARINEAEALLKPLGIVREDLLMLLHTRMDEQYRAQKAARTKKRSRTKTKLD
jgi:hypothetical protein